MLCHEAAEAFPSNLEALGAYDAVILSSIGANRLVLPAQVWVASRRTPNRLRLLGDYVAGGGALVWSAATIRSRAYGAARFRGTAVEEALPVSIHPWDDRLEIPEGTTPVAVAERHPVLAGVPGDMPYILGCNEVVAKPGATTVMSLSDDQAGIRSSWWASMAAGAARPGRATSGRTGCPKTS